MDMYDRESGQIFKETIVKSRHEVPWQHHCLGTHARGSLDSPSQDNVKTLQTLAMQKLIQHASQLTSERLEHLPHAIAIRIWTAIRREWRESFHIWTAFVNAGFKERTFKHALRIENWYKWPLVDTFSRISSPSGAWIVDLTLADVDISPVEFREVSRIVNLQNLHLQFSGRSQGRDFDNRVVRAWSNRAQSEGAFKRLQTFSVVNAPGITSDVFEQFSKFPAISVFVCGASAPYNKGDFKKAQRHGWLRVEPEADTLKRSYQFSGRSWNSRRAGYFKDVAQSQRLQQRGSASSMARLDARLGPDRELNIDPKLHACTLCFRKDLESVAQEYIAEAEESDPSRKRYKTNASKAAGFAAMLNGG